MWFWWGNREGDAARWENKTRERKVWSCCSMYPYLQCYAYQRELSSSSLSSRRTNGSMYEVPLRQLHTQSCLCKNWTPFLLGTLRSVCIIYLSPIVVQGRSSIIFSIRLCSFKALMNGAERARPAQVCKRFNSLEHFDIVRQRVAYFREPTERGDQQQQDPLSSWIRSFVLPLHRVSWLLHSWTK